MTQYLFSVIHDWSEMPEPDVMEQMFADVDAFNKKVTEAGHWVFGGGLCPPETATVVNNVDGKVTTTDGPYVETKEMLGGFWILELPDLDAALALAAEASVACRNPIEVRPFQAEPEA
ncbi:YciI family protein [Sporichthya brevicatena]|uniref:YciI family protein n=2 Tax=Sporichthya brevicatena TaxID=171442 RepID=A0ABN1H9G8_9ACTN